jgi:hypothetical protein
MSAVFSSTDDADGIPPIESIASPAVGNCGTGDVTAVSDRLHHRLTDSERENAIHRAGDLFLKYMAKYEATSDLQYLGDARRALLNQSLLIQGRSAEMVARMEKERGLR